MHKGFFTKSFLLLDLCDLMCPVLTDRKLRESTQYTVLPQGGEPEPVTM